MAEMFKVSVTGAKELERNLRRLGIEAGPAIEKGVAEVGQRIIGDAMELVPVDTGTLRATGTSTVERTKRAVSVVVGFGGPAAWYALAVHENPRAGKTMGLSPSGKKYRSWAKVGQWQYLAQPFKAWAPKAADVIAKHVKRMLDGLTRGR